MCAQEVQDPEKVSLIWAKNLNSIVSKMHNTKSLKTDMELKDANELETVELDKSETYPKDESYLKMIYISQVNSMENKKHKLPTLSGVNVVIVVIVFFNSCKMGLMEIL